ncbi:NDR1/HIN1-like protein 13 [Amborella trichopoda]|uniref:Late embryogenesis abundant protein LEA-2 subgroup domain-containing protein n=1 Tax=Amborella trichopoda TaxID=13333 RepID=W1PRB2_AMBTC|nr:NDR1/HIN1-like protein 13 [Amborella trichopoda]ERN10236.1 hypothetical protein AMTR_s00171p00061900 [Amborella trichopoda]|eukprot:XP_006848655.1 NDR1/HIN1-like protein 13 [Amborella trichopoda]
MADQQRIHPVDVEAPPTAPLAPRDAVISEKGDPPKQFSPFHRTFPVMHSKPPKRKNCCCRFLCWTMCFLITLIILIGITLGALYLIFRPKLPEYSVDRLRITAFNFNPTDMSLYTQFAVTITAKNPNKKIGIYYEDGSHLSVWYSDTRLCTGALPKFYQGHQNTTVMEVALAGQNQVGSGLQAAIAEQQSTGMVPLLFRGDVPVRIKFGALKLMKITSKVRCNLVVDSLSANNQVSIRTGSCKFRLKL